MSNDALIARIEYLLSSLTAEVQLLRSELAVQRADERERYAALLLLAEQRAGAPAAVAAVGPGSDVPAVAFAPGFIDRWLDPPRRPELYHPDLRTRSQTYLTTCADMLARRVAEVPPEQWLAWRQPPGWYATDAQHAAWLAQHGGAPTDDGGTVAGPG